MTNAILVEETLQKIQSSEGVIGLVILNVAGPCFLCGYHSTQF